MARSFARKSSQATILCAALVLTLSTASSAAVRAHGKDKKSLPSYCKEEIFEQELRRKTDLSWAYQPRDVRKPDRCEGAYGELHGRDGRTQVVSILRGAYRAADSKSHLVGVAWPNRLPPESRVTIAVQSMTKKLAYRMDTSQPASSTGFEWRDDVMQRLHLSSEDLGVLAWEEGKPGVYLPITWLPPTDSVIASYFVRVAGFQRCDHATVEVRDVQSPELSTSVAVQGDFQGETALVGVPFERFRREGVYQVTITIGCNSYPVVFQLRHDIVVGP